MCLLSYFSGHELCFEFVCWFLLLASVVFNLCCGAVLWGEIIGRVPPSRYCLYEYYMVFFLCHCFGEFVEFCVEYLFPVRVFWVWCEWFVRVHHSFSH